MSETTFAVKIVPQAQWQKADDAKRCQSHDCNKEFSSFSFSKQKDNCHCCGITFCMECLKNKIELPPAFPHAVLVCPRCYSRVFAQKDASQKVLTSPPRPGAAVPERTGSAGSPIPSQHNAVASTSPGTGSAPAPKVSRSRSPLPAQVQQVQHSELHAITSGFKARIATMEQQLEETEAKLEAEERKSDDLEKKVARMQQDKEDASRDAQATQRRLLAAQQAAEEQQRENRQLAAKLAEAESERLLLQQQLVATGADDALGGLLRRIAELEKALALTKPATPSVVDSDLDGHIMARLLGKGSFGSVYEALLPCGKQVCVKQIELGNIKSEAELQSLQNEINLMKRLHHVHIVEYYGSRRDGDKNMLCIFMQLVTGGSVTHFVKTLKKLPLNTVRSWTLQILAGVSYLHKEGIIHRDIKGENILVSCEGIVKLADFGCSKQIDDVCSKTRGCNTMVGTPYWMAPEVIKSDPNTGYGAKSDIWSVGCTVVEMITGRPPWPESDSMWAAVFRIGNSTGLPPGIPENLPPDVMNFLLRCFERDPKKRATAEELLEMPWMASPAAETNAVDGAAAASK